MVVQTRSKNIDLFHARLNSSPSESRTACIYTHTHGREPTVGRSGEYDKETITHLRKQSHIRTQRFTWFRKTCLRP